jgi:hypothetical protein
LIKTLAGDFLFFGVRLIVFIGDLTMKEVGTESFKGLTAVRFEPVATKVSARSIPVEF